MGRWLGAQLTELGNIANSANVLINEGLPEAWGAPGQPGNVAEIVFVARRLGAAHRHAVEWSQRIKRAYVEERFRPLVNEMSKFSDRIIEELGNAGPTFLRQIEEGLARLPGPGEEPLVINMTITFELGNLEGWQKELERLMSEGG
jgi:hypothetical protein